MVSRTRFYRFKTIVVKLHIHLLALLLIPGAAAHAACKAGPATLQVLGSGGPFGHGWASAGYLVWVDGVAR